MLRKPPKPKTPVALRALNSVLPAPTVAQKLASLSVFGLQDVARGLMHRHGPGTDTAFKAVMDALEKRMASKEYVAFCAELEKSKK